MFDALETVDATGLFAANDQGWKEGDTVRVADWKALKSEKPLAVGSSADIALLKPAGAGACTVVRIIRTERALR